MRLLDNITVIWQRRGRMAKVARQSLAAAALERVMQERGPASAALLGRFNRSHLYNLWKGFRKPSLSTALAIEQMTEGSVRAPDWDRYARRVA